MTQQNQPTLFEEARLTWEERALIPSVPIYTFDQRIADAATRKAFETILAWLRDDHGGPPDHWMSIPRHTIADELEAQIHPEGAHDA